jgi:transcriptional regulator with XRE-family HTH domain
MNNRIAEEIKKQGFNKHSFSAKCGVPYGTLYRICKDGASMDSITIDNFLKIAHGLGMTAEELYYGKPAERTYSDDRQVAINAHFETFNDEARTDVYKMVERMSHDPHARIEKDGTEHLNGTQAMGA